MFKNINYLFLFRDFLLHMKKHQIILIKIRIMIFLNKKQLNFSLNKSLEMSNN